MEEVTYESVISGGNRGFTYPTYAICATPFGPVELTPQATVGTPEAVAWLDNLLDPQILPQTRFPEGAEL